MKDICIDFCSGPCTVFLMLSMPWYVQDGSILTLVTDAGHNPPLTNSLIDYDMTLCPSRRFINYPL